LTLPDLSGRTAVLTGASRGIGAGLAREFHARGMRLALCSRTRPDFEDGERILARSVDVADGEAVEAFAAEAEARFGHLDLWINNAGVIEPMLPLRDIASADFRRHVGINLDGVFHGTRAFVRHLRRTGKGGVLINISSGAAWQGYAGWAPYCASKAGVERLTETVQIEEQAAGLRAHAVAPGVVDTGMQDLIRNCTPEQFPMVERFREMKRTGSFNTIPFVARHLLSIAFDPDRIPEKVAVRLPQENG